MQTWQKVWPQGVSSGCTNGCKQSGRVIAWDEKNHIILYLFCLRMPKVKILRVNKGVSSGCTNSCKQSGRDIAWLKKKYFSIFFACMYVPF